MKKCCNCKKELFLNNFYKNKFKKDGYYDVCKKCWSKYSKKRYCNNHKQELERSKKYRNNNRDKINSKAKNIIIITHCK